MSEHSQQILIIGGTSGIGWALAQSYLQAGHQVTVAGRHPERLDPQALQQYRSLQYLQLDIADAAAVRAAISGFAATGLDLLIVSAGSYVNSRREALSLEQTEHMLATNVSGLVHAFQAASELMLRQGRGQLVAIASIAGLMQDYPGASVYAATKRSVIQLADTYRRACAPFGVHVTTIIPGYVDTQKLRDLNQGDASHKPFLSTEQQAASRILQAIASKQATLIFPRRLAWLVRLLNCLPAFVLRFRPD